MKNWIMITSISVMTFGQVACKSKEKAANEVVNSSKEKPENSTVGEVVSVKSTPQTVNYRLVVQFFSPGNGIDGQAVQRLEAFLKLHPKNPAVEMLRWGREGEIDYCFQLKELSAAEQSEFIEGAKKAVGNSERTRFFENYDRVKK